MDVVHRVVIVIVAGCGRFGFETGARPGDAQPDVELDAARPDAPPNAQVMAFAPAADTYVSQDMEGQDERPNNFGADDEMKVKLGEEHGLLRFDVTALPGTVTLFSADLRLVNTKPGVNLTIGVFPVRESWVEGTGSGGPGVCNWTMRDGANAWTTAGAAPPGSAEPMIASFPANQPGTVAIGLPTSLVAAWRDQAVTNFGVLLRATTDDDADFGTRESIASERPALVVTFLP